MTHHDTPSRTRLLLSARKLFAENGYESTSTASIARMAGTSESQLIKHFGGKAGLLDAIFVDGWNSLTTWLQQQLPSSTSPIERLRTIPRLMFEALQRDPELRQLLLLEGRRIRKEGRLATLTDGFLGFVKLVDATLEDMRTAGQLRQDLNATAIRSALIGLTEGALRDQLLAERAGNPSEFTPENIGTLVDALVESIAA
ncbi:MAG TPA: TetR/AcrR family transcriptional regulator [Bryobacteraceae bacterium]|nr:TetR/AcrR family transcriptional regulator [Bryobacteraceae bacterium]